MNDKWQKATGWLLAGLISLAAPAASAQELAGRATVVDGDTIEVHRTRIRLFGIDAPESAQLCLGADSKQYRCGAAAANKLDAFIEQRPIVCSPVDRDRYGRIVAVCSVAGIDLGDWMVRGGLAIDYSRYSRGEYVAAQREEFAKRGMWSGSFVAPWDFRSCLRSGGTGRDLFRKLSPLGNLLAQKCCDRNSTGHKMTRTQVMQFHRQRASKQAIDLPIVAQERGATR